MPILSKRIMTDVGRAYYGKYGLRPLFVDLAGKAINATDGLENVPAMRRKRNAALQESLNLGAPAAFKVGPVLTSWVVGIEDRRMVHGGVMAGPVMVAPPATGGGQSRDLAARALDYLASHGLESADAVNLLERTPTWTAVRVHEAGACLQDLFYQISGWDAQLMKENRLKCMQQEQISQAVEDQKGKGGHALYAFEKERVLLANIRAGDRNEARRSLNEMLATIYLSSPQLVVLRARTIEMISCLTRAAIEDNPLLEPLIERNHAWTERLIKAESFERLSQVLMDALDDFIDGVYLHGVNRSNTNVRRALDYISANFPNRLSLHTVAGEVGLSRSRLAHLVKALTGRTVHQVIDQVRIRHAQHLLDRTSKSCAEIAYEVGFADQGYFTKHFRRLTGTTPARYRRGDSGK